MNILDEPTVMLSAPDGDVEITWDMKTVIDSDSADPPCQ